MGLSWLMLGCPQPEDQFVVSGRLVGFGKPQPGVEVRLLRNQYASAIRCDALELFATTRTDETGQFAFSLLRQQVTRGNPERRFFRVEFEALDGTVSKSFWFPDADLTLGDWDMGGPEKFGATEEVQVDGRISWRREDYGERFSLPPGADQSFQIRTVLSEFNWLIVPQDSLGRDDSIPVETKFEAPWERQEGTNLPPGSRGALCPNIDVLPCPLSDGRYLPYAFPVGTRNIVLNLGLTVGIPRIFFHGLVLEKIASKVRLEFNFVQDESSWNMLSTVPFDAEAQGGRSGNCNAPGAYFFIEPMSSIKPVFLRITFLDEASAPISTLSLTEISI